MKSKRLICFIIAVMSLLITSDSFAQSVSRVTILYDAFGKSSTLKMDWGFSAFVEYGEKRILFDTGNNAEMFAHNVKALGVDLSRLDFVVISHRHGDHTSGLHYLLEVNPGVKIYTPNDEHFGGPTPPQFYQRSVPSLPVYMRYFGGALPESVPHGSAWRDANIVLVNDLTEVAPGIRLIPTGSQVRGTLELPELSLSLQTPQGQVLVAGCSHPGIEKILEASSAIGQDIRLVFGGFHLVTMPEAEIERLAIVVHEKWKIKEIAPGHCTGEPAFAALQKVFGDRYIYAGVGTTIDFP